MDRALTAHRTAARAEPPMWTLLYRVPTHLAILAAGAALVVKHLVARALVSLWQAIATLLVLAMAITAAGMLVAGDAAYTSSVYDILRGMPGGIRSYGAALAGLVLFLAYGYGQQHAGHGHALRVGFALAAAWYALWLVALVGTSIAHGRIYSWSTLTGNALIAGIAITVARSVPPDRT